GRHPRTARSIPLSTFREAHFAELPDKLVEPCLQATWPAQGVVLDPCSGAGTSAVGAQRLGRRLIGFDCNPEYCQIAEQRLAQRFLDFPQPPATDESE
ncbi:MAG: DNA methyltransferase, partial [Planctomycetota bacterium]